MNKRLIAIIIVVLVVAVGGYLLYAWARANPDAIAAAIDRPFWLTGQETEAGPLQATGIVEAHSVTVSSEQSGRLAALHVAEGETVSAGQLLAELDDSLLQAQIAQAGAAVTQAQAQLALVRAGARDEEIALAEARLAQAEAAVEAAKQAWEDAQVLRDNRQELDLAIIEAETAAAKAARQARAARLAAEAADLQRDLWGRVTQSLADGFDVTLPGGGTFHVNAPAERDQANVQWNVAGQRAWEAWQTAYAAEDAARAANTALADLRRQRATPIAEDARVNQAEAAYRQALAAAEQARAAVQVVKDGAPPEQIEVARQAVARAQTARAALDVPLAQTRILSPRDGLISALSSRQGEIVAAGTPLLEIADLDEVTLTVYIPAPDLGRVRLGQAVEVTVDSFPGREFAGRVAYIADRAEFTPKNVQTAEERVNTVFAVEIVLPNPDHALKPGMPADALFTP